MFINSLMHVMCNIICSVDKVKSGTILKKEKKVTFAQCSNKGSAH